MAASTARSAPSRATTTIREDAIVLSRIPRRCARAPYLLQDLQSIAQQQQQQQNDTIPPAREEKIALLSIILM